MRLEPGTCLGPYEILAPLGAGGMGEVYRARDSRLDREVAIKVLPEHLADDQAALARFEREAKAVAALSHPNILAVHDVGTDQGTSYVVTELLGGETLRERTRGSALPWRKAIEIGAGVADGMAAAHAKGIIHRDLKPENIFITSDGVVKILDFGLARMDQPTSPEVDSVGPTQTLETKPGAVMGTTAYMSPEQVRGRRVDARSDIFSFGCVLYEMVTGGRTFARDTPADTMAAILNEEPPEIDFTATGIPPDLDRIIRHCLEKMPEDRFQSARDLAFDLRSILTGSTRLATQAAARPARSRAPTWIAAACLVVVALAALYVGVHVRSWRERATTPLPPTPVEQIHSLAVLPLENLSGDPEQEYFADGMTDALISNLAKIGALRVISRTSAMHFKGTDKSIPQIARELHVDAVVEGSVVRAGSRVRIAAQLIHGSTDRHLWADSYERELRDILALQSEVARAIAREIRVTLTPQEQSRLADARPVDPEPYQLYLRGRYHWNKRTEQGLNQGIDYFRRALELDPTYALAYAALADCYVVLPEYGSLPPEEAFPKARTAALKALEIDDTLAEAHASLGMLKLQYDWDWSGAEESFKRAIELNPTYATAHHWYAILLMYLGRQDESVAQIKWAQELDPLSAAITGCAGYMFYYARQYDRTIEECRSVLELDPDSASAHGGLADAYVQRGMYELAVAEAQRAAELSRGRLADLGGLGVAYARGGKRTEALRVLADLKSKPEQQPLRAWAIGVIYTALGDRDQAFEWLNRSCDRRDVFVLDLKVNPLHDPLRDDPRFDDLVRRIGLDPSAYPKPQAAKQPVGKIMLAVLPFTDMSPDPQEWFSDGVTEELISQLGRVQPAKLGVIARTSAMHYKGKDKRVDQIGRELGVQYLVEGSVRRRGDNLRVTAKLIRASDQTHIWSEDFDRTTSDLLAIQSDLAQQVARVLAIELLPRERDRLTVTPTVSPEAHEAYLKGRYHFWKFSEQDCTKAVDYFQRALEHDPDYALAFAGLADAYWQLGHPLWALPPAEAMPKARAAARKALDLDETLAEAHVSLGLVEMFYDWDFAGALREFERAIELSPSHSFAYCNYAACLLASGRTEDAISAARRAQQEDPFNMHIRVALGEWLWTARRYEEAKQHLYDVLELDPSQGLTPLAWAHEQGGEYEEAISMHQRGGALSEKEASSFRAALAAQGPRGYWGRWLKKLSADSPHKRVSASQMAAVHAALGENDQAFEWLERAYRNREGFLPFLDANPKMDPLRDDPRFDDLLRRIGLKPDTEHQPSTQPSELSDAALPKPSKIMLAVLPFDDIGAEPQEWFSDGMTEEMIAQLGRLQPKKLGVIARTSAMRYKGTAKGIDQIGRELGVDYILEGSVRRAADQVRITAKLIQVSDQTQLWATPFDGELTDVFALQANVAERIASSLAVELLPSEQTRLARARVVNPEAHEAYLKGRYCWNKRTEEGLRKGLEYFRQAIELAPDYAQAYSGLADSYSTLAVYGAMPPNEAFPKAREAAIKALEIDDALAEAQTSLAAVKQGYDWDWPGAERHYQRAIKLNASYATAHHWYAIHLGITGRVNEAIASLNRARELDPLSLIINANLGWFYRLGGQEEKATEQFRNTLEMDGGFESAHIYLSLHYAQQGSHEKAIAELELASAAGPEHAAFLGYVSARAGLESEAREILDQLEESSQQRYVPPCFNAWIHMGLGEDDEAFKWLDKAYRQRDTYLIFLNAYPMYDTLRDDPRFADLLRRIGLEL